jgi:poly [ADP-ribose] polymerase
MNEDDDELEEPEDEEEQEQVAPPPKKKKGKETAPATKAVKQEASASGEGSRQRHADRAVPDAAVFSVYRDFDIKLNQTNIDHGDNNNKFYIIQVLQGKGSFWHWNRWGRVGETVREGLNCIIVAT